MQRDEVVEARAELGREPLGGIRLKIGTGLCLGSLAVSISITPTCEAPLHRACVTL